MQDLELEQSTLCFLVLQLAQHSLLAVLLFCQHLLQPFDLLEKVLLVRSFLVEALR
jgi:hypothetical protein